MEKYLNTQPLLENFVRFALTKGVPVNKKEINISKDIILTQLKAYISRNILGDEGFYPLLYKNDKTVEKALEVLSKK